MTSADQSTARLAPCPTSPNCVLTLATDRRHAIAPLRFTGSAADAMARLRAIVDEQPGARVVECDGAYLRAEFSSRQFRFVDDVEFVIDATQQRIDFRSASRVGYWDWGANRRRMERIRGLLHDSTAQASSQG